MDLTAPRSSQSWPEREALSTDVADRLVTRFAGGRLMNKVVKTEYAVVKTQSGEVRGSVADGVHTFKGIPYAAPPFGANRLRPPQPVAPWSGVRDALAYGPKTPQQPYPLQAAALVAPELVGSGEDCLT